MASSGSSIARFDDPEAFGTNVHHVRIRVQPLVAGNYLAKVTLVRLPSISFAMGEENISRIYRSHVVPDRIFFRLHHADDPPSFANGREDVPGTIRMKRSGDEVLEFSPGPAVIRSMSMQMNDLAKRAEALFGCELDVIGGRCERISPRPAHFTRLACLQRDVFRTAAEQPEVLAHPAAAAALEDQVSHALVAMLFNAEPQRRNAAERRGTAIMGRVQDILDAEPGRAFTLTELCKAGGCSATALEKLFRERLGMTPIRHLRSRRLSLAHRALKAADPRRTSVSQVALDCGFWELGRFAVAYRNRFGESPSQTLRLGHKSATGT